MNNRPSFLSGTRVLAAAATFVGVLVWMLIQGQAMFSPGGLNTQAKGQTLGGVTSHAQLGGNCGACHASPWGSGTMDDRCNACHTDVASQIQGNNGIHGGMAGMASSKCATCHGEHGGPNGPLSANFNHNSLPFKLTGAHANVPCNQCHTAARSAQGLANTPQDCYSCHAAQDKHNGTFGTDCGQCHNTTSWANANFNHTIFPINHGSNQQTATCKTCHPNNFSTYTCYGCHFHTTANVLNNHEGKSLASLADCIKCHPQGRQAGGG